MSYYEYYYFKLLLRYDFKSSLEEGAKLGGAWRSSVGTIGIYDEALSRAKGEGFRLSETPTKTRFIRQILEMHLLLYGISS